MMKNFVSFAALLALATVPTAGCIISDGETAACDDGLDNDGDGLVDGQDLGCTGPDDDSEVDGISGGNSINATWSVSEGDPSTAATWTDPTNFINVGCPVGFETLRVVAQPVDGNGNPQGNAIIDQFDCVDGSGTTAPYTPGEYQVWVEITNDAETQILAQSASAFVNLTASDVNFSASLVMNGGYFTFGWLLNDGAPAQCSDIGAESVSILSTISGTAEAFEDLYNCTDGQAITAVLPHDTYTVSIAALDNAELAVADAPALTNETISQPNEFVDLGTVTLTTP